MMSSSSAEAKDLRSTLLRLKTESSSKRMPMSTRVLTSTLLYSPWPNLMGSSLPTESSVSQSLRFTSIRLSSASFSFLSEGGLLSKPWTSSARTCAQPPASSTRSTGQRLSSEARICSKLLAPPWMQTQTVLMLCCCSVLSSWLRNPSSPPKSYSSGPYLLAFCLISTIRKCVWFGSIATPPLAELRLRFV